MVAKSLIEEGARFGKVTVIREVPVSERRTERGTRREFIIKCDCGVVKQVPIKGFIAGRDISCGCHGVEARKASKVTHGLSESKPYRAWAKMKERCDNERSAYYHYYGGRGIKYDPRWECFSEFWEDMGETYTPGYELDRIDPNKGYCKENCQWSNESFQAFNQRKRINNTSGRTGVYLRKGGKWWAEIQEGGRTKYLGVYESFEEACAIREAEELRIYGKSKTKQG